MSVTTFPIELPNHVALMHQLGFPYDFVLSWANSYRSLEFMNIPTQANILPVGSFLDVDGNQAVAP
ncbi:MAG TPA: hypothetical protein VKB76_14345, partial [Ktedonobacterales bacterium]|nr:hypothetical protein [Ktedonobacterales bacterium]